MSGSVFVLPILFAIRIYVIEKRYNATKLKGVPPPWEHGTDSLGGTRCQAPATGRCPLPRPRRHGGSPPDRPPPQPGPTGWNQTAPAGTVSFPPAGTTARSRTGSGDVPLGQSVDRITRGGGADGVGHAQRGEHLLGQLLVEGAARDPLHDARRRPVVGVAVGRGRAGRCGQPPVRDALDAFGRGDDHGVGQARGVRQQLADGDGVTGTEVGQVACGGASRSTRPSSTSRRRTGRGAGRDRGLICPPPARPGVS